MKASNCKEAEAHKGQFHAAANSPSLLLHCMDPGYIWNHRPVLSPLDVSLCCWKALDLWSTMTKRLTFFANFRDRCVAYVVITEADVHKFVSNWYAALP